MEIENNKGEELTPLNLIIIFLSLYVLGALIIETFADIPEEISKILNLVDNGICIVFLYDFAFRFKKAPNKLKFMRWGWIDLLSSIPAIDVFRAGRLLRLIRLLRIVRAFKSTHLLVHHIFKNRAQGAVATASVVGVMMIVFSAIAILQVETDPTSNIKSAEDAIWWAITTITTVGYGDRYPVTTLGRIVSTILMITGIGLFGTFSGLVSSWLSSGPKHTHTKEDIVEKNDDDSK
ncbi:MAG: potassium channel family protein [Saprospiraceae bacterium]|jgi:voltage-gated potassium channel|nr:potassium channel family protein [Saprospiraceae bacterium]MBK6477216.1 potassium channel family protein [Saprospiraceae bacterium]MBK6814484.1 potassium channel family protein [Saprospiraceae bacterium]MBK7369872.1 potassium channel family protein [Saprospiraceae bacterium]MBK7437575.1 potassium channel family protein [Saprospiraceae bacterium]